MSETISGKLQPKITSIDQIIASNIRAARIQAGLSQSELSSAIGVTYQQQHKYERGLNRISACRLWKISRALNVPIEQLYTGCGDGYPPPVESPHQKSLLNLCRDFAEIEREAAREMLCAMAKILAEKDKSEN